MEYKVTPRKSHYPKDVPFEVPEGWCWTTIGECLINRDGERVPISSEVRMKQKNKVFDYYGAAGVIDKVDGYLFNERLLLVGEDGANLLSKSKDNAFFAEGKYWVNNHAHILDATIKPLLDYIALYINSIALDPYITGSAQPKLNQDNLNRIPVPLPPFMEQLRINYSMAISQKIIDSIAKKQEEIDSAVNLAKYKVLDLAIHGKLVPQDPSEEPAIELLKRINPDFKPSHNLHYEDCPIGWQVVTLKEIVSLYSGRDLEAARCNAEHRGIPYLVGASCIDNQNISVYRWTENPEVVAKINDTLLSCKGTVGEVILNQLGDVHIARQFMSIRSKSPQLILPKYIELIIKASIEKLRSTARGIIPGISREDILEMTVAIPPLAEQKRILTRISELESSLSFISLSIRN